MSRHTWPSPDFKAVPRFASPFPENTDVTEAHKAAEMMKKPLHPQGVLIASVLEAKDEDGYPLHKEVVIQEARRSAKTTSIQAVLLGRCFTQDDYQIVMTAQTQSKARRIFLGIVRSLDAAYPDLENRGFKCRIGNGQESILWENGSSWWVVAPNAAAFRSDAADVLYFEEAGEYGEDQTTDLVEGAMPLMDTRPRGQIIIAGTPPKTRAGMLWDYLKLGRDGKCGIVDFSMGKTDDPTDEATWWRVHPGLASGLTTIRTIRDRFDRMALVSFMREYLCADPGASSTRAIDEDDWLETQIPELLPLPQSNITYCFDVAPDGSSAAVSAGWYDADGRPHIQVVEHRSGDGWVANSVAKLLRARLPVVYDNIGANVAVAQKLQALRGLPLGNLTALNVKEVAAGVSVFMSALGDRALVHAVDKSLDNAVEGANFRYVNDARLLGRRTSTEDVAPLVAASNALYVAAGKRFKDGERPQGRTL